MKCNYCDWTSMELTDDDAYTELSKHERAEHALQCVSEHTVLDFMEIHFKYGISIDEIFNTFYNVRERLAELK